MAKRSKRQQDLIKLTKVGLVALAILVVIAVIITQAIIRRSLNNAHAIEIAQLQTEKEAVQAEFTAYQESIAALTRHTGEVPFATDPNWNLRLINSQHPLEMDFVPNLTEISDGVQVDSRIAGAVNDLLNALTEAGFNPVITSAYRTPTEQRNLFNSRMASFINQGWTPLGAFYETSRAAALPGFSEHASGLAIDISEIDVTAPAEGEPLTGIYLWLQENSWRFGFIQRYPVGKTDITGVVFEPWHFRYVGNEAAQAIFEAGITLEEFLGVVSNNMVFIDPTATPADAEVIPPDTTPSDSE